MTRLSVGAAMALFSDAESGRLARARSPRKIVKEIARSAAIPVRCRARLPDARAQRRDAVGWRGAAHPAREPGGLRAGRRHVHSRRAVDRAAPARQSAPARHARAPARPRATPSSWSSTMRKRSAAPTSCSTSARAPACTAVKSSRRARRATSRPIRAPSPAISLPAGSGSSCRHAACRAIDRAAARVGAQRQQPARISLLTFLSA